MELLGKHLLVDFFGVESAVLKDKRTLMRVLSEALEEHGFNVIHRSAGHKFAGGGQGVTGFFMLTQSHAAFHSYPEYGYLALDIYCCGTHDPERVAETMARFLRPRRVARVFHRRGAKNPSRGAAGPI